MQGWQRRCMWTMLYYRNWRSGLGRYALPQNTPETATMTGALTAVAPWVTRARLMTTQMQHSLHSGRARDAVTGRCQSCRAPGAWQSAGV